MKKIICVLSAAAMMAFCFVGCGNDGASSAVQDASKAVSDVGSQVATVASDMAGNGTVSDSDGVIGNEGSETSANEGSNNNENSGQNQTENANQEAPSSNIL